MVEQTFGPQQESREATTPLARLAQLLPPVGVAEGSVAAPRVARWILSREEATRLLRRDRRALWRRWWGQSWLSGTLAGIGLALVPLLVWCLTDIERWFARSTWMLIIYETIVLLPALGLAWSNWLWLRPKALPSDEAPLEDGNDAWLCDVRVIQDGVVTGEDRGVVFFEPGAMGFYGRLTSFVLTRDELDPAHATSLRHLRGDPRVHLRHNLSLKTLAGGPGGNRNVWLSLDVASGEWPQRCQPTTEFSEAFEAFWRDGESPALEGELPPLALGPTIPTPSALARASNLRLMVNIGVVYVAVLMAFRWGLSPADWWYVWATVLAGMLWLQRDRSRVVRVLSRVESEERGNGVFVRPVVYDAAFVARAGAGLLGALMVGLAGLGGLGALFGLSLFFSADILIGFALVMMFVLALGWVGCSLLGYVMRSDHED